jgi:hypothetical protein
LLTNVPLGVLHPDALWQRCIVHFYRNVFTGGIGAESLSLTNLFTCWSHINENSRIKKNTAIPPVNEERGQTKSVSPVLLKPRGIGELGLGLAIQQFPDLQKSIFGESPIM